MYTHTQTHRLVVCTRIYRDLWSLVLLNKIFSQYSEIEYREYGQHEPMKQVRWKRKGPHLGPSFWQVEVLIAQSCLTLCDSMNCSLSDSSVHGILQAGILERVAISFSRGSSWLRDRTHISCLAGRSFTIELPGKPAYINWLCNFSYLRSIFSLGWKPSRAGIYFVLILNP